MKGTQASARNLPWSGVEIKIGTENKYMIIAFAFGSFIRIQEQATPTRANKNSQKYLRLCFVFIILMVWILNKPNFMSIWLCCS